MVAENRKLNFSITEALDELIKEEADRLQISKADFIRMRLVEYFEKKEPITIAT